MRLGAKATSMRPCSKPGTMPVSTSTCAPLQSPNPHLLDQREIGGRGGQVGATQADEQAGIDVGGGHE
jgi:hypothetical protein